MPYFATTRNPTLVIAASYCATVTVGTLFLVGVWSSNGAPIVGVYRAILFVTIMAAVHAIGAALYFAQNKQEPKSKTVKSNWTLRSSILLALSQQCVFMLLTALILDGGYLFRCFTIALLGHWFIIGMLSWRRRESMTTFDLGIIRYGYLPIALIVGRMVGLVHQWNGDLP